MEWDQITEKWAIMTRRLCHDGQGADHTALGPRRNEFATQGGDAPTVLPALGTLAPLVNASPDP